MEQPTTRAERIRQTGRPQADQEEREQLAKLDAPRITTDFIEWLQRLVPDRAPTLGELRDPLACAERAGRIGLVHEIVEAYKAQGR